ncbi:hypothetical protein HYS54_03860 [Candidatus Micrarchaeota archaeon]|nr:hypothetical protein [Candidatus Micrarchaeota archaeon]
MSIKLNPQGIASFAKVHRIDIAIFIALFLLAFGVRSVTSEKFTDIYGFDSFWAARQTQTLINQGWVFPYNDTITDYPYGRITNPVESGWWIISAVSYKVVAIFTSTQGFDYHLFSQVFSWLNVLVGSLAIPFLYLFGKKAFNRITGLTAALLLSGSANHLFYSIYGHDENDATGLTFFFASLFLLVWAIKSRDLRIGVLFSATLAWLSITWQAYIVVVWLMSIAFTIYFIIFFIGKLAGMYQDSGERSLDRKWIIYSLLLAIPSVLATKFVAITQWDPLVILPLTAAIIICSLLEMLASKHGLRADTNVREWPWQQKSLAVGVIFLLASTALIGTFVFKAPLAFAGIVSEPRDVPDYAKRLDQTIAEQNPVRGAGFLEKLGTLAVSGFGNATWLAFLGALFAIAKLFIMPLMRKDFRYEWDLVAVWFVLYSMIKLTSVNQTAFFLSAAIAFGAGYFMGQLYTMLNYFGKQIGKYLAYAKAAVFCVALMIFFSYNTVSIANTYGYNYDIPNEWFETFNFFKANVTSGAVVTPWWDYGHWLLYYNGDKLRVSSDNVHGSPLNIWTTAMAFTHTTGAKCFVSQELADRLAGGDISNPDCPDTEADLERAELEALEIMRPMKTTHILVDKEIVGGGQGGKFGALEHISQNQVGCFQAAGCEETGNGAQCPLGQNDQGQTVGITFNASEWQELVDARWPGVALFNKGIPTRAFVKKDSSGIAIYMSALSCGRFVPHPLSPSLFAFQNRLFFNDPWLKYVKKVFDNKWILVYEVDWNAVDKRNAGTGGNATG